MKYREKSVFIVKVSMFELSIIETKAILYYVAESDFMYFYFLVSRKNKKMAKIFLFAAASTKYCNHTLKIFADYLYILMFYNLSDLPYFF